MTNNAADVASAPALRVNSAVQLKDEIVQNLVPLSRLHRAERAELLQHGELLLATAGTVLAGDRQDPERSLYLIEGTIALERAGRQLAELSASEPEARFALTRLRSRQMAVRALTDAKFLQLDMSLISILLLWAQSSAAAGHVTPTSTDPETGSPAEPKAAPQTALKPDPQPDPAPNFRVLAEDSSQWLPKLLRSELFSSIPAANLHRVFEVLEPVSVTAGEAVVRQGEPGVYYYVIRSGSCNVTREPAPGAESYLLAGLGPGDSFGEEALVADSRRNATVTMLEDGELLRLTKEDFVTLIIQPLLENVGRDRADRIVADGGIWLDVRLPEEHEHDGLPGSTNIPLNELRSRVGELRQDAAYVVYCNAGRRSSAAVLLLKGWGFDARVLQDGLLGEPRALRPAPPTPADEEPQSASAGTKDLVSELAQADTELEEALRLKVEATAARRLFADQSSAGDQEARRTEKEKAELRAKLKRVELESLAAGRALSQAQRTKLEIEAKLRSEAAKAEKLRRQAQAQVVRLAAQAEVKLRSEQQRLSAEYAESEAQMVALDRARADAEANFNAERGRMESELQARLSQIEQDADALRTHMKELKSAGARKLDAIRAEKDGAQSALREETEKRLRVKRERLEAEFASAMRQIESAQRRVDQLKQRRTEADQQAKELAGRLKAAAQARQARAEAEWQERCARLEENVERARARAAEARHSKEQAEAERQALYQELERLREASQSSLGQDAPVLSGTSEPAAPASANEAALEQHLARQDEKLAAATGEVDEAERAACEAQLAREGAEVKEAQASAALQEIHVRLYAEAQEWLELEDGRSREALAAAQREVELMERSMRESETRKAAMLNENQQMLADIHAQLEADRPDALETALGNRAYAAQMTFAAETARAELCTRKELATAALERARAHITRLKEQKQLAAGQPLERRDEG